MNAHNMPDGAPLYGEPVRETPNNIDAEQAVLGAVLVNNAAFHAVSEILRPEHFYEPLHRKMFDVCGELIRIGKPATPITVKTFLPPENIGQLTVAAYLARLATLSETVAVAVQYAQDIVDMAVRRKFIMIGEDLVQVAYDAPPDTSPRQMAFDAEARLAEALVGTTPSTENDTVDATVARMMDHWSSPDRRPGVPLPLPQLRDILGGDMEAGTLCGMLSASGEGKTSLALQIVDHAARAGHPVMVLSFDQSDDQIVNQMASQRTGIESSRIRAKTLQTHEQERYLDALLDIRGLPIRIRKCNGAFDTAGHLVGYVKRSLIPLCRKAGPEKPGLVILDHSRKVKPTNDRAHEGRIAADMNGVFKQAAADLGLVWFNLMQRSGSGVKRKNPRPIDSDIFGGEMGREDYDAVFYLYRAWKYWKAQLATAEDAKDEDRINARFNREKWEEDEAELGVLKWRFGDPSRRFRVRFEAQFTRYVSKRPEPVDQLFEDVA